MAADTSCTPKKEELDGELHVSISKSLVSLLSETLHSICQGASEHHLSSWGVPELVNLKKVAKLHHVLRKSGLLERVEGSVLVEDRDELEVLLHWLRWAKSAYDFTKEEIMEHLGVKKEYIYTHNMQTELDVSRPSYFVAENLVEKAIVICIRGTSSYSDILTDLTLHGEPFVGNNFSGYAHAGFLKAARWIFEQEEEEIVSLMEKHPNFRLVVTGHSLGGGTAVLLSYLINDIYSNSVFKNKVSTENGNVAVTAGGEGEGEGEGGNEENGYRTKREKIQDINFTAECWTFGCPPCLDATFCKDANFIYNVVLQDDFVTRVSATAIEELRKEMIDTSWDQVLQDGSKRKKVIKFFKRNYSAAREMKLGRHGRTLGDVLEDFQTNWCRFVAPAAHAFHHAKHGEYGGCFEFLTSCISGIAVFVGIRPSIDDFPLHDDNYSKLKTPILLRQKTTKDVLEKRRLVVPGYIYHIVRTRIDEKLKPPVSFRELKLSKSKREISEVLFWEDPEEKKGSSFKMEDGEIEETDIHTAVVKETMPLLPDEDLSDDEDDDDDKGEAKHETRDLSGAQLKKDESTGGNGSELGSIKEEEEGHEANSNKTLAVRNTKLALVTSKASTFFKSAAIPFKKKKKYVKYSVLKGSYEGPRLMRIVLSEKMFIDHFCDPYANGIIDSICWFRHST